MKKTLGIILILIGAGLFSFSGFNHQEGKTLNDKGLIINNAAKKETSFNWFPYLGAVVFIGGVLITTAKSSQ